jgi:hypothetical protein
MRVLAPGHAPADWDYIRKEMKSKPGRCGNMLRAKYIWYNIPGMQAELVFHEKVVEADGGIVEVKIWSVPEAPDMPHGYKYSLVYIKGGKRMVGYDNAEGKGDHRHYGDKEEPYGFKGIDELFEDFHRDVRRLRDES